MINFDVYTKTDSTDMFYFVDDIQTYGISFSEAIKQCSFFQEIVNLFNVDFEYIENIIKKLMIPQREIFEFSLYSSNIILMVKENGVYTLEKDKKYYGKVNRKYHNVYIKEHTYISTIYPEIAEEIFKDKFSDIYNNKMFLEEVRKYPSDLKFSKEMKISDFSTFNMEHSVNDYKIGDLVDLINNPKLIDSVTYKSKFKFYGTYKDVFYLSLFNDLEIQGHKYDISLYLPIKAFIEKDWKAIEEKMVYSIIKPNAKLTKHKSLGGNSDNFFNGKQKDSPYFNCCIVNELKKYFFD